MEPTEPEKITPYMEDIFELISDWVKFQTYIKEVPSISIGLYINGKSYVNSLGYANLENKIPATPDFGYRIASHSKVFCATIIMQLVDQERVSLEDKITKYLPWIRDNMKNAQNIEDIRIKHLLTHSGGITRDGTFGHWGNDIFPLEAEFKEHMIERLQDDIHSFDTYPPSTHIKYSNIAYTLLGLIIKEITGKSFENHIEELCTNLGMNSTFPDLREGKLATGYGRKYPNQSREQFEQVSAKVMNAATGVSSTIEDIITFYRAHFLSSDLLLSNYAKREMQRLQFKDKSTEWGLGFQKITLGSSEMYGHGGGYPGFITFSAFDPVKEIIIAVFTNAINGPARLIANGIMNILKYFE